MSKTISELLWTQCAQDMGSYACFGFMAESHRKGRVMPLAVFMTLGIHFAKQSHQTEMEIKRLKDERNRPIPVPKIKSTPNTAPVASDAVDVCTSDDT
jgi:hypothetical protein